MRPGPVQELPDLDFGAPGPPFCTPPDLDFGAPRPRFWCPQTSIFERFGVIPLLHYYIVTLLLCYIITLLLCYFVSLLLARWRGRSFAALLDKRGGAGNIGLYSFYGCL